MMRPSQACVEATSSSEGLRLVAYLDGGGVPTIGYGHTRGVKLGDTCTKDQAVAWRQEDLAGAAADVNGLVKIVLKQYEFDAIVALVYNVGGGKTFRESRFLRKLNAGDKLGAAMEMQDWSMDNGVRVKGLLMRRFREALMFLGG